MGRKIESVVESPLRRVLHISKRFSLVEGEKGELLVCSLEERYEQAEIPEELDHALRAVLCGLWPDRLQLGSWWCFADGSLQYCEIILRARP